MSKEKICVTGGSRYVGFTLGMELARRGFLPTLLDWTPPPSSTSPLPPGLTFIQADIRDEAALRDAFQGASIVFHVASYGMSGSTQLNWRLVEAINVRGTRAVINAALAAGVERLVFTSTYNVVFGGQSISGGDESLPYFPFNEHVDIYSKTKGVAEQMVLNANGILISNERNVMVNANARRCSARLSEIGCEEDSRCLWTCAVRPAAIWGPDEQRHTPRIVSYLERGLFSFVFGDPAAKMDFVHVKNLVQGHILAAEGLKSENNRAAAGQAYFISDGEDAAINNFEFFRPLVEGLGYSFPRLRLPFWLIYFVAFLTEWLHWLVAPWIPFEPLLTRAECFKAGINHWFVLNKARSELGYRPRRYRIQEVVKRFKDEGHGRIARDGSFYGIAGAAFLFTSLWLIVHLALMGMDGNSV